MDLEKVNNIIDTVNHKSSLVIDYYFNLIRNMSAAKTDCNFNDFYSSISSRMDFGNRVEHLKLHFKDMMKIAVEIKQSLSNVIDVLDGGSQEDIQHCIDYFYVVQKLKIIGLSKNKQVFNLISSSVIECLIADMEEIVSREAIDFAEHHVVTRINKTNDNCLNYVWEYKQDSSKNLIEQINKISKQITQDLKIIEKDEKYSVGLDYVKSTIYEIRSFIKVKLDSLEIDSMEMEFKKHMLLKYRLSKENAFKNYTKHLLVKINLAKSANNAELSSKTIENNANASSASSSVAEEANKSGDLSKLITLDDDSVRRKEILSEWRAKREKERQDKAREKEEIKQKLLDKAKFKVNESIREANVYIVTKEKIDKNQLDLLIEIISKPLTKDYVYDEFASLLKRLKIELEKNSDSHIKLKYQGKSANIWRIHGGDDRMPHIAIDFIVEALWSLGILQGEKDLARGNKNNIRLYLKSDDNEILLHEPENRDRVRYAMRS